MPYLFALPVLLTLLACGLLVEFPSHPGAQGLRLLLLASAACGGALLFVRAPGERSALAAATFNSVLVTAVFVLVLLVLPDIRIQWIALLRLAVVLQLLLFVAMLLLFIVPARIEHARPIAVTVLGVLIAVPIWLAPVAEATGNGPLLTNLIVAISPLSAFAVALEFDLLRSAWFYAHSALGSLRYEYLSWFSYIAGLGILGGLILAWTGNRSFKRN